MKNVYLIAGLGNPDANYALTYHNAGMNANNYLARQLTQKTLQKSLKNFRYLKHDNIIFINPLVFMNESGKALKSALNYFKVKPKNLIVLHDDSDIELGKYKMAFGRGSAGHKGVESIIKALGTKNFWRIRIGIRKNSQLSNLKVQRLPAKVKAEDMVLKKISRENQIILQKVFGKILSDIEKLIAKQ